jgi:hypothetical protein
MQKFTTQLVGSFVSQLLRLIHNNLWNSARILMKGPSVSSFGSVPVKLS